MPAAWSPSNSMLGLQDKVRLGRPAYILLVICLAVFCVGFYCARRSERVHLLEEAQTFLAIQEKIAAQQGEEALKLLDAFYPEATYGWSDVIWYLRGRACFERKDYDGSVRMLEQARAINPLLLRSYDFLYYYSLALYAAGHRTEALKAMETALLVSPKELRNAQLKKLAMEIRNETGASSRKN